MWLSCFIPYSAKTIFVDALFSGNSISSALWMLACPSGIFMSVNSWAEQVNLLSNCWDSWKERATDFMGFEALILGTGFISIKFLKSYKLSRQYLPHLTWKKQNYIELTQCALEQRETDILQLCHKSCFFLKWKNCLVIMFLKIVINCCVLHLPLGQGKVLFTPQLVGELKCFSPS